mmetsp:Transcript_67232/g.189396  ORF Transcript_67232/g.189396 Transcript_67232/m.189396 type:complete len:264 (+) Transcript_67232:373-1164(+)
MKSLMEMDTHGLSASVTRATVPIDMATSTSCLTAWVCRASISRASHSPCPSSWTSSASGYRCIHVDGHSVSSQSKMKIARNFWADAFTWPCAGEAWGRLPRQVIHLFPFVSILIQPDLGPRWPATLAKRMRFPFRSVSMTMVFSGMRPMALWQPSSFHTVMPPASMVFTTFQNFGPPSSATARAAAVGSEGGCDHAGTLSCLVFPASTPYPGAAFGRGGGWGFFWPPSTELPPPASGTPPLPAASASAPSSASRSSKSNMYCA